VATRDKWLHVRLTDSEHARLQELAEQTEQSRSDLARQALATLIIEPEMEKQKRYEEVEQ